MYGPRGELKNHGQQDRENQMKSYQEWINKKEDKRKTEHERLKQKIQSAHDARKKELEETKPQRIKEWEQKKQQRKR